MKTKVNAYMNRLREFFGLADDGQVSTEEDNISSSSAPLSLPPGLHVSQQTDVGRQRENNQDSYFTVTSYIEADGQTQPFGLFIVADGMGGYKGGEKASAIALRTAADHILNNIYLPEVLPNGSSPQNPINEVLTEAVTSANASVLLDVPEAGTTLTVAVVLGHQAYFAHVGDSRAYIYSDGKLNQITNDHSVVARMVEVGQLTPEEALTHKNRNVLYRAIGQSNSLEVETHLQPLPPDSYLLICSDGLWNQITDDEISSLLGNLKSLNHGVQTFVDLANHNGGDDNITVVLVGVGE